VKNIPERRENSVEILQNGKFVKKITKSLAFLSKICYDKYG